MYNRGRPPPEGIEDLQALGPLALDVVEMLQFEYEALIIDLADHERSFDDFDWQTAGERARRRVKEFSSDDLAYDAEAKLKRAVLGALSRGFERLAGTFRTAEDPAVKPDDGEPEG